MDHPILKWLVVAFVVVAAIGFADSTYLSLKFFKGETPPCTVLNGCDSVINSAYGSIGPVPTSLLGSLYYLAMLVAGIAYLESGTEKLLRLALKLTVVGLAVSAFLVYIQVFVIGALCLYCLVSAATSTLLFVLAQVIFYISSRAISYKP